MAAIQVRGSAPASTVRGGAALREQTPDGRGQPIRRPRTISAAGPPGRGIYQQ